MPDGGSAFPLNPAWRNLKAEVQRADLILQPYPAGKPACIKLNPCETGSGLVHKNRHRLPDGALALAVYVILAVLQRIRATD